MIAKDMKRGDIVVYNGAPIIVENLQVQTPSARGAATLYKVRCRNLITKDKVDLKLKGTDMMDEADFRRLHNWPDMYWNAERILADLPNWKVYLHRKNGAAVAALVCRAEDWPEIFSVDFDGEDFRPESYRAMMAACLNDLRAGGHRYMTYFEEDECALPILAELGFQQVGRYLAYRKELKED